MALVLVVRPWGCSGVPSDRERRRRNLFPWRPFVEQVRLLVALPRAALLPLVAGNYVLAVASEVLIFMLFAASLHLLVAAGGLVSFGHAAYFGLGAYGAALALKQLGLTMAPALLAGSCLDSSVPSCSAGSACACPASILQC